MFTGIKVGDLVRLEYFEYGKIIVSYHPVDSITPKGFIKVCDMLFTGSGSLRGRSSIGISYKIRPFVQEEYDAYMEKAKRNRKIKSIIAQIKHINEFDDDTINTLYDMLCKE